MQKCNDSVFAMDIRFLHTFIEVANTRHFGRAAENLYVTQSAVSARIRQLEEYFNAPLFIRERHCIRLTSVGEKLLPFAVEMVSTLQDARKVVERADVLHLSIGATGNAWYLLSDVLLNGTTTLFPEVLLRSESLSSEQLSRQLHERTIDVALSFNSLKSDDFVTTEVGQVELQLFKKGQGTLTEALSNLIQINWTNKVHAILSQQFKECRYPIFQTNSASLALKAMALKESASILLPNSIAAPLIAEGVLMEVENSDKVAIKLYVSSLKSNRQASLGNFFDFYANPNNYGGLLHPVKNH
jgi:DNA-binding transcriptional LysR family regulator